MNILLRTFNNRINSKTGVQLPEGQYRGTPEWLIFERILVRCLESLGHWTYCQLEMPGQDDLKSVFDNTANPQDESKWKDVVPDTFMYVHQTKREKPQGNLFWMQMHMRQLFTIDTNGWGADHSGNNLISPHAANPEEARRFCREKSDELLASGISKCDQPVHTDTTPSRFILVPVQIPRDYTIKWHSPVTVKYFLESIQSWAVETQNHVCFKLHPFNAHDYDLHHIIREASENSDYVHKVDGNIHELIKRSSGLFVINSGTGFEALIHGKPVSTFGDCDYKPATFNADLRRLDEARNFIYSYKEEWRQLAYQFVWYYWHKHAYDVNQADTPRRLTEYLKGVLNV